MVNNRYLVFWQPGCSSCLKAKEFLTKHGIEFESVNVRSDPTALDRLAAVGARSIPVVMRGADWTYGQDLGDVARFIGVDLGYPRLPPEVLVTRVERLLAAAHRLTADIPEASLEKLLPGRVDRAIADLAWHVPKIVEGFLAAAQGASLTFDYFLSRPEGVDRNRAGLLGLQSKVGSAFAQWWRQHQGQLPAEVDTYYGRRTLVSVLERTAWHVAQHVRQLESLLEICGVERESTLGDDELEGLPLPEGVWDPEIGAPR